MFLQDVWCRAYGVYGFWGVMSYWFRFELTGLSSSFWSFRVLGWFSVVGSGYPTLLTRIPEFRAEGNFDLKS